MLSVIVYPLKHKFRFNKIWIFVAVYGIQKLKTKTCFSQTLKVKIVINELIDWKLHNVNNKFV